MSEREPNLRVVALPVEHGGWGLLGEPLVLALLLAPSRAGVAIAAACVAAFLLHTPVKLILADLRRGERYPRTALALRVATTYAVVAGVSLLAAAAVTERPFWVPLALAAPLAAVQLGYGARNHGRRLVPEIAGAAALAASAPAILLAGGSRASTAAVVWALLAARGAGSIIYIRARLRRDRGMGGSRRPAIAAHAAAAAGTAALAALGHAPWAAVAAFALLLARAAWGLSSRRAVVHPRAVGFQELGFGAASTALVAAGFMVR